MTFYFESFETMWFQIHEMHQFRPSVERISLSCRSILEPSRYSAYNGFLLYGNTKPK